MGLVVCNQTLQHLMEKHNTPINFNRYIYGSQMRTAEDAGTLIVLVSKTRLLAIYKERVPAPPLLIDMILWVSVRLFPIEISRFLSQFMAVDHASSTASSLLPQRLLIAYRNLNFNDLRSKTQHTFLPIPSLLPLFEEDYQAVRTRTLL